MTLEVNPILKEKLEEKDSRHIEKMKEVLKVLSSKELIFKGGSALLFGYGLDRFSEDLDFDSTYKITSDSLINMLRSLNCNNIKIKKDTDTTKRILVVFGEISIKIEVSLRNNNTTLNKHNFLGKIDIYDIDSLANMKLYAFENRTTARDVYDLGYILFDKHSDLSYKTKKRFIQKFSDTDFVDFLLVSEPAFKEDSILTEDDLFESVTRLRKGISEIQKTKKDLFPLRSKKD